MSLTQADHRPTGAPSGEDAGLPRPRRDIAIAAAFASLVLVVLDGAIANVALPTLTTALHVTPAQSVWVVTGYQMALVMALLPCAAFGESYGHRRVFLGGVLLFTAASALCALSPSLPILVLCRFIQGLGGACVMALAVALLRFTFPRRLIGGAIGWMALTIALSAAAGPTIGAGILSIASWPWLFAVNLPVGAIVLLAGRALPAPPGTGRRPDAISVGLNAATFAPLVVGVDLITDHPLLGTALLVLALASLVLLIRRERPRAAPLIPIDLLRDRAFRLAVVASICCFAGQMASYVALPFYLQHGLGQDAFTTGLYMTPWPLTVAVAGPIAGRLADRTATGLLCGAGGLALSAGLTLAAFWPLHGSPVLLIPFTMLCGLGFGFFQVPNNRTMLLAAPRERSGAAGGMQGTARLTGQTAGAVLMTLLFRLTPSDFAPRIGLAVGAALALAGALVSLRRSSAAAE